MAGGQNQRVLKQLGVLLSHATVQPGSTHSWSQCLRGLPIHSIESSGTPTSAPSTGSSQYLQPRPTQYMGCKPLGAATWGAQCATTQLMYMHQGISMLAGLYGAHPHTYPGRSWAGLLQHCSFSTGGRPQADRPSQQCQDPEAQSSQAGSPTGSTGLVSSDPESLTSLPNLVSLGRAISAPFIAGLILSEAWEAAIVATALSGLTDWADGALARRLRQTSVLGSYLDPLADKLLVGCVVGALAAKGLAPLWVAALIIGRDVGLVTGMFLHRWRMLGWRLRGVTAAEFFRTAPPPGAQPASGASGAGGSTAGADAGAPTAAGGVPFMRPLFISKANTVFQLLLVGSYISHAAVGAPGQDLVWGLEVLTAGTTAASLAAYAYLYATGRMLALQQPKS